MQCRNCGKILPSHARACPNCGTFVQPPSPPVAQQEKLILRAQPTPATPAQHNPSPMPPVKQERLILRAQADVAMPPVVQQNPAVPINVAPAVLTPPLLNVQATPAAPIAPPPSVVAPQPPAPPVHTPAPVTPAVQRYAAQGGTAMPGEEIAPSRSRLLAALERPSKRLITIFCLLLVAVIICSGVLVGLFTNTISFTGGAKPTPTVKPGTAPSGLAIVPQAAAIIPTARTSSEIDTSNALPVKPATSFVVQQTIYITYTIKARGIDFSQGPAYVQIKYYADNQLQDKNIVKVDKSMANGYFAIKYATPTNGAAELYWCRKVDCSDAKLARFLAFMVTEDPAKKQ